MVLSALPALKDQLLAPQLFPLWRRIRPKVTLTGLRRNELEPFLAHGIAPDAADRFEPHALDAIFKQGRGTPALLADYAQGCLKAHPDGRITQAQVAEVLERIEAS